MPVLDHAILSQTIRRLPKPSGDTVMVRRLIAISACLAGALVVALTVFTPAAAKMSDVQRDTVVRRACEAAIWGMAWHHPARLEREVVGGNLVTRLPVPDLDAVLRIAVDELGRDGIPARMQGDHNA